jgi:integrase
MTVGDWLELWTQTTKAEVSPKSHERYAEIVRCYLAPALGTIALQRLTPSDIQKAYNNFTRNLDRNPSPRTRRHIHRILKSALARAVEQQALPRNPADALKRLPKVEVEPITVLTVEQATRLLKAISHTASYWPTLIALATGMRQGEILALRWKNLDLDHGTVRVMESLDKPRQAFGSNQERQIRPEPFRCPSLRLMSFEVGSASKPRACCALALGKGRKGLCVLVRMESRNSPLASLTSSPISCVG